MKKVVSVLLALALVLGICGCTPAGDSQGEEATGFRVGYAKEKIMPSGSVPLKGYGRSLSRMSTGFLNYLYFTCVAISDADDNTALMLSVDSCTGAFAKDIREKIYQATGIPAENITITATHSHSTPDMGTSEIPATAAYVTHYKNMALKVVQDALADRKTAKMFYGTAETQGLNFVRHYLMADGSYAGDNFGDVTLEFVRNATEVDPTIHILKFTRDGGKDVVMMNWRAHPTITGSSTDGNISADYVSSVRDYMEKEADCLFAYYQGAAGNVNPRSRITADTPTKDYKLYGQQLGGYAMKAIESAVEVEPGTVKCTDRDITLKANHVNDHLLEQAKEVQALWNSGASFAQCKALGMPYGIRSPYMANAIVSSTNRGATINLELHTISIGDSVAFCTANCELFDTNGAYVEDNSPYEHTIVCGYTNGQSGYLASAVAWEYTCYETDTAKFAPGSAEQVADRFLEMLKEHKGQA